MTSKEGGRRRQHGEAGQPGETNDTNRRIDLNWPTNRCLVLGFLWQLFSVCVCERGEETHINQLSMSEALTHLLTVFVD